MSENYTPRLKTRYREEIKGVPLYSDTVHFSPAGAAMVWTWLTPRVVEASRS